MEVVLYCARKKRLFFLGLFLFFIMLVSGIYSLNKEINTTEVGISTGAVDIEIKEYDNTKPFDEDGKYVMPGDEIVLIPRVNNLGVDCYLRAKNYGKTVVVHITVEAVQAKNFNGNWDSVDIRKSIDRAYDIDYEGESSIIYDDNTNKHITIDNGFFNKLGNMLPGDSVSESLILLNKSSSKNEYYLSIDYDNLTEEELKLLQKIRLLIKKQNGDVLVDSNLENKSKYNLGIYETGKGETFKIEVSIPEDVNNDFSKLYTKIKWDFSYMDLSDNSDDDIINPLTLDLGIDIYLIVFVFSTIGLIIDMFLWKKENHKK